MIVDLNLQNKIVVVVGGGNEAQKRINSLLKQECKIIVISDEVTPKISKWSKAKKITLKKQKVKDTKFISELKPSIIITTTNDKKINQKIVTQSKKSKIMIYSSDNPEESDFSNPAVLDFENTVQIAIFTGGKSPAISKKLKSKSEKIFKKVITKQDIAQIKIQKIAREIAKKTISTQIQRKEYIHSIMDDKTIKQLIKEGQVKKAEKHAIRMLENWK